MQPAMRAMVLSEPRDLQLRVVADPVPGPDEMLVEISACAVCRTDLQIVSGDLEMRRSP